MKKNLSLTVCGLWLAIGSASAQTKPSTAENLSVARAHDPNRPEVLMLALTRAGFDLPTVAVEAGQYVVKLDDRSGRKDFTVQLTRSVPNFANPVAVTDGVPVKGRNKFESLQNLTSGMYRLSISENPKWACTIEVK